MEKSAAASAETEVRQGASLVVLRRDSVLLVERARAPFAGLWSFPGGGIEPGEAPDDAARRELFEETALTVGAIAPLGTHIPRAKHPDFRLAVFAARALDGEPVAADDARQALFVPFAAVLERPLTEGAAGWIARAVRALGRSRMPR